MPSPIFTARRLPGRITAIQTAGLLGFQLHDIAPLMRRKLLRPLGKPAPNAPKWFASAAILKLAQDEQWLSKATELISRNWREKNVKRPTRSVANAPLDSYSL